MIAKNVIACRLFCMLTGSMRGSHLLGTCYAAGPTACIADPKVRADIVKRLKSKSIKNSHDFRVASAMGIIRAEGDRPFGFNDGIFYPPLEAPSFASGIAARPQQRLTLPSSGKRHMNALALMVDFPDLVGKRPAADFDNLLFNPNNPASMSKMYEEMSNGRCRITGQTFGYFRAPHPYNYYTDGQSGTGFTYPHNTPGLVEAVLKLFTKSNSLTQFDADGDGYVDGVFLIHAGAGAESEISDSRKDMIWSHKWTLRSPFISKGVKVFAYSTEPEDGRLGVFAHEFGHVLGLPDLYDTNYLSSGVGEWCLMGGGSWGNNGNRPCDMSCWCKYRLGWLNPNVIKRSQSIELRPLADLKGTAALIPLGASKDEYLLLENRDASRLDACLPGSGLLIWHINESRDGNTNPNDYLVGLVQADGLQQLNTGINQGDSGDAFPGSKKVISLLDRLEPPTTRLNNGGQSGVALKNIRHSKKHLVTLDIRVSPMTGSPQVKSNNESKTSFPKTHDSKTSVRRNKRVNTPSRASETRP